MNSVFSLCFVSVLSHFAYSGKGKMLFPLVLLLAAARPAGAAESSSAPPASAPVPGIETAPASAPTADSSIAASLSSPSLLPSTASAETAQHASSVRAPSAPASPSTTPSPSAPSRPVGIAASAAAAAPVPPDRAAFLSELDRLRRLYIALQYYDGGDYERAEEYGLSVLREMPDDTTVMTLVGSCRLRLGNDTGAVEIFTRYVRHHPFDALGYFSLGVAYQSLQNRRKAVENYWAALLIDPNMEPARVNLRQLGAL